MATCECKVVHQGGAGWGRAGQDGAGRGRMGWGALAEGLDSTTTTIACTHREVYLAAAHDVIQEGIFLHHLTKKREKGRRFY